MVSSTTECGATARKRKIKNRERDQTNVTFSTRKLGLFNKLTELSILCQAETALIIVTSGKNDNRYYACGYPAPEPVIRRFLSGGSPPMDQARAEKRMQKVFLETLRVKYEATQEILNREKKRLREAKEAAEASTGAFPSWWQRSVDGMGLEELEQFKESLENLKMNLVGTMQEKILSSMPQIQPSSMLNPICPSSSTVNYQAWDNWSNDENGIIASSSNHSSLIPQVDNFGHYSNLAPCFPLFNECTSSSVGNYQAWNDNWSNCNNGISACSSNHSFFVPQVGDFGHY